VTDLCCGFGTAGGGIVGASMAGQQWKKEVVVIMQNGCPVCCDVD